MADICLVLTWMALMTVRDLMAAYHLVRLAGSQGDSRYLVRWITNYLKTGYMATRTMQSGPCG